MRFGVSLAEVMGSDVPVDWSLDIARQVDSLGYDSLWVADHLAVPTGGDADGADYRQHDGVDRARSRPADYEALTMVSALAAITSHVQVGTAVLTLPFRHPAITAKMLAAADLISGGRVVLGVGTGWLRSEFEALGLPDPYYDQRDTVTDEFLLAVKEMWLSTGPSNFTGQHLSFSDVGTFPKPTQRPHPPIVVGGHGREAMIRASRHGTGYLTTAVEPAELAELVGQLRAICERDRRDFGELEVHMLARVSLTESAGPSRPPLTGDVGEIAADLMAYGKAGLEHLIIVPAADAPPDRLESTIATIEAIAADILPAFGGHRTATAEARH
ncbi:MAG: luciferase-like protein [Frankiales bacterium]|nr:luciferase-like protein [Frankiales bacterium]